ncbi:hypothetical protein R3P38DRAFT_2783855 [Favolaschia claudopus]|uniref:F-box domain-containing protein n=1 Tax=Favolaschia claudopus TaxID=2862362 RepID=A0AAW0B2T9_9AGAR
MALRILEILDEILRLAIEEATSHQFLKTDQHPFDLLPKRSALTFPSTAGAALLRVCKLWRGSGCRFLYRTVILSRQDQVVSFANALRQNQNSELHLGSYIKVFVLYLTRMEFGEQFAEIFQYSNRLETLSISTNVDDPVNIQILDRDIDSLLDVLPAMNPRELILRDLPSETEGWVKHTKPLLPSGASGAVQLRDLREMDERRVLEKICDCIRHDWKDLKVLRMAIPALWKNSPRHSRIYSALPYAPNLREIHLRKSAVISVVHGIIPVILRPPPITVEYLNTLAHLQRIILQCHPFSLPPEYLDDTLQFRVDFAPYVDLEQFI